MEPAQKDKAARSQFIAKLHETLTLAEYPDALHWVSNDTFEITVDEDQACQALSPAWDFRSLSSFIRQLSYYGFKRLSDRRRSIERKAGVAAFVIFAHPSGFFVRDDVTQLERILRKSRTRKAALVPGKRQRRKSSTASSTLEEPSRSEAAEAGPSQMPFLPDAPVRTQWTHSANGPLQLPPLPHNLLPPFLPPLPDRPYAPPSTQAYYSNSPLSYFNSSVYSPFPPTHFPPDFSFRNPAPLHPPSHLLPPPRSPKTLDRPLAPLQRDPNDYYAPRTVYSYQEGRQEGRQDGRNHLEPGAGDQHSRLEPYLLPSSQGSANHYPQKPPLGMYAQAR